MRILVWHVHGSWMTSFVHGRHEFLIPVLPGRGPEGRGRARTWDWPAQATEIDPRRLRDEPIDVVVLQRPDELELARQWTGRAPGRDLPAVYVEHNAPEPSPVDSRHLLADRDDIHLAHVTQFNRQYWDNGRAPTTVIDHGVVDPGYRYTGELARVGLVSNEPVRRSRTVGTDIAVELSRTFPIDHFGAYDGAAPVGNLDPRGELPQDRMHSELARRRVYLHPYRWTSLGLSLLEAMHLGLPVVALAATEAGAAVPAATGVVSNDPDRLQRALHDYLNDVALARQTGRAARAHALEHYGLTRFLDDWDALLRDVRQNATLREAS